MLCLLKNMNKPGTAIFIEFRKAFDTIEWSYILSVLKLFKFGRDIQNWIRVIYHNTSSCVLNNWQLPPFSNYIEMSGKDASCLVLFL